MSLTADTWIKKYAENASTRPRRFLFIGTTNRDDFLTDPTGNRRFLPFHVGRCSPDAIRRDREQLWAEAAAIFNAEGVAYAEAERLAHAELDDFADGDELLVVIEEWLSKPPAQVEGFDEYPDQDEGPGLGAEARVSTAGPQNTTTIKAVMEGLGMSRRGERLPRAEQMRVGNCLRRLGWTKGRETTGARARVWTRPKLQATQAPGAASYGGAV